MKYKLINSVSKIETICDKVTMDGFDYYVSDELQEKGDPIIHKTLKDKVMYAPDEIGSTQEHWWKVIATTNQNIDVPKVLDEVERLAEKCTEETQSSRMKRVWKAGYNKSQETYPFSEDDMIDFYKWVNQPHPEDNRQPSAVYIKNIDMWWHNHKKHTSKELLQLWKEQQPKIIHYESK